MKCGRVLRISGMVVLAACSCVGCASVGSVSTFSKNRARIYDVRFSPDSRMLATAGDDGVVRVWNIESRSLMGELSGDAEDIESVCFSPDSKYIVAGGARTGLGMNDRGVLLQWRISDMKRMARVFAHEDPIEYVDWMRSGDNPVVSLSVVQLVFSSVSPEIAPALYRTTKLTSSELCVDACAISPMDDLLVCGGTVYGNYRDYSGPALL